MAEGHARHALEDVIRKAKEIQNNPDRKTMYNWPDKGYDTFDGIVQLCNYVLGELDRPDAT